MRLYVLVVVLLFSGIRAHALELRLDTRGLQSSQVPRIEEFIRKGESLLPPSLKERLNKTIWVRFDKISAHGETKPQSNAVLISEKLLGAILAGPANAQPNLTLASKHKTYYDVALGTLLHEISHQYDFFKDAFDDQERRTCLEIAQNSKHPQLDKKPAPTVLPSSCYWKTHRQNVSDDLQFLYSLGWNEKEFDRQKLAQPDDQILRSPNPYEFKSPAEAFAVNFEFFLMDPEYQCRRPSTYRFLSRHFSYEPFAQNSCAESKDIMVSVTSAQKSMMLFDELDAARIYQVHYLVAGEGDAAMSNWGHSMLRFVICAPNRTTVGPECLQDIVYHKVVSYRASVADIGIDKLKGLMGQYPSRIYILPMLNIINEYTKLELRSLYSYPLNLNSDEIHDLVTRVKEQFWSYRGKYYFVTNNCAVETLRLLKNTKPGNIEVSAATKLTPFSVRDLLIENGYSRNLTPQDFESKLYFWPSKQGRMMAQLRDINTYAKTNFKSVSEFFDQSSLQDIEILQRLKEARKGLSSFLILEMTKLEKRALRKNAVMMDYEMHKQSSELVKLFKENLAQSHGVIGAYFKGTYGIPSPKEVKQGQELMDAYSRSQQVLDANTLMERKLKESEEVVSQILGRDFMTDIKTSEALVKQTLDLIKELKNIKN